VSEYLNDDDRVHALRSWWEANGTFLVVGVVLTIAAVVGWRWYNDHSEAHEEAASTVYQQYLEARERGAKSAELDAPLATLDNEYRKSSYRTFTLFYRALDAANADDYAKATQYLETAVSDAGDDRLRDIARLRLARVQVQSGNTDAALATLAAVRGAGFRSYVAELKGDILMGQNKPDEAREAYLAAQAAADPDNRQPFLEMKIADLAKPGSAATPVDPVKPDAPTP
jgi:predicted negative regulator of RcsB-dependent stress response